MPLDFMAELRRDGARFAELLVGADLAASVPSCPEWTTADLGHHLAEVHAFWATMVAERLTDPDGMAMLPRPHDSEVPSGYAEGFARLLEVFDAVEPDTAVWAWWGPAVAADIVRRMAQETAMHLCDLQLAVGEPPVIEPELAADGIDELFEWFLPWVAERWSTDVGGSVHLHCTDVAGEWTLFPDGDGVRVTREHAKGDCALRGSASDLLLVLWRRIPLLSVDVVGDASMAERFVAFAGLD